MPTARSFYPTMLDYAEATSAEHDGFIQSIIDDPENTATHAAFSDWLAEHARHVESLRHHLWAVEPKLNLFSYENENFVWVPDFKRIKPPLDRLRHDISRTNCPMVVTATGELLTEMHDWPWPYGAKIELKDIERINVSPRSQELRHIEAVPNIWKHETTKIIETHQPLQHADIFPQNAEQADIDLLAALPELARLKIKGDHLGDANFGGKGFPALRRLSIALGEKVTLRGLRDLPALESLTLTQTELHPKAAQELAKLKNLRHLSLNMVSCVDLLKAVSRLKNLESLYIGHCNLPAKSFKHLETLTKLTHLEVSEEAFTEDDLRVVSQFQNLTKLWIWNTTFADERAAVLGQLRKLRELSLHSRTLSDGFGFLANLTNLVNLRLDLGRVTFDGTLAGVREMQNLRFLQLTGRRGATLSAAALAPVTELKNLQNLSCNYVGLDDAGLASLSKLESLLRLELFITNVTPRGLSAVRSLRRLRELSYHRDEGRLRSDAVKRLQKHLPFAKITT